MPDAVTAEAPGRVNLMGEHTDYQEGFVLPTLIPQRTRIALRRRADRQVRATSVEFGSGIYELGHESRGKAWLDYVQGVTAALAQRQLAIDEGFDAQITSEIPGGAGVSSSAALTVALLRGLRALFGLALDDVALAMVARAAETDFVGAPVGIMDQMACSLGIAGEAMLLDTRSLDITRIALPPTVWFAVIDSGVSHQHASGGYQARRRESFDAAAALGVAHLRDAGPDAMARLGELPPVLARRARHVMTENGRVLEAADALRAGDARRLGTLFNASHQSLRDDYEVSTPEIDRLVDIARHHDAVYGARLTGGGFGGAVVVAMQPDDGGEATRIATEYAAATGRPGSVLALIAR